jgi:hypothetical protein
MKRQSFEKIGLILERPSRCRLVTKQGIVPVEEKRMANSNHHILSENIIFDREDLSNIRALLYRSIDAGFYRNINLKVAESKRGECATLSIELLATLLA